MNNVEELLQQILSELQDMNDKLDDLRGNEYKSIDDICEKLDKIHFAMR